MGEVSRRNSAPILDPPFRRKTESPWRTSVVLRRRLWGWGRFKTLDIWSQLALIRGLERNRLFPVRDGASGIIKVFFVDAAAFVGHGKIGFELNRPVMVGERTDEIFPGGVSGAAETEKLCEVFGHQRDRL